VRTPARGSGAVRASAHSVAPTGITLTANTVRHELRSTSVPPTSGPATKAMPVQAVQVPIAFPCAGPSKCEMMSAIELGTKSAPATPCSARAAMRRPASGASAHMIDVAANPTRPAANTRRRPNRSESDPAIKMSDPSVSR